LPYGLRPRDFFRAVEDVQDLIQDLNSLLDTRSYSRLELLMDPAGYSGLLSRTVADRLSRASVGLVVNGHHNGYPDLIPAGRFPNDAVARSNEGLEVKASRNEAQWQSHGPRAGWFTVLQFQLDDRDAVPPADRDPTTVVAIMAAELAEIDWSWQPAKEGRIRSGTASVRTTGAVKLRRGASWIRPDYLQRHAQLLLNGRLTLVGAELPDTVRRLISSLGSPTAGELVEAVAKETDLPGDRVRGRVSASLRRLVKENSIVAAGRPARFTLN
jgi:hypothetical protein